MYIHCVLFIATLYIDIHICIVVIYGMDFQCTSLATMLISSWAWVFPPWRDYIYFSDDTPTNTHHGLTQFRALPLCKYIGMYFSHQLVFWPHTLKGICYSPKFHICAYKTLAHPFPYFSKNTAKGSVGARIILSFWTFDFSS